MSFEITTDERGIAPLLMCWECNSPIMDLKMGTVMWLPIQVIGTDEDSGDDLGCTSPIATFLHKGKCSQKHDAIHRSVGNYLHCMEIGQFFEAWFQGSQFPTYDRDQARRTLQMLRDLEDLEE